MKMIFCQLLFEVFYKVYTVYSKIYPWKNYIINNREHKCVVKRQMQKLYAKDVLIDSRIRNEVY